MNVLLDRLAREPVLIGGAVYATLEAAYPDASPAVKLAWTAWITLAQHMFSTSKRTAEENVEGAKYVGAVEHQAVALAGQVTAEPDPPTPAKPPAKKAALAKRQ